MHPHENWAHGLTSERAAAKPASAGPGTSERKGPIFRELEFIRLDENWRESSRDAGLWGGDSFDHKVFRQFQLGFAATVTMDFWFRGFYTTPQSGRAFTETLRFAHVVTPDELMNLREVLGVVGDGLEHKPGKPAMSRVHSAEVGMLKGRMVLAVRWEHLKLGRLFSSVFIDADGDGRTVHEIHFSAPRKVFDAHVGLAHEAFRSIQWRNASMPPMSGCA